MSTLADRITERLKDLDLTPRAASLRVGSNPTLISDILRGKVKNPRSDTMPKLAEALETSTEYLLTDDDEPSPVLDSPTPNVQYSNIAAPDAYALPKDVPLMGTAAGSLAGAFQLEPGPLDYVLRPPALVGVKDIYAIRIGGHSMLPEHRHGDLRFANPYARINVGDTVLITARYRENGPIESFIKELVRRSPEKIVVKQHNPPAEIEFRTKFIESMHKILTVNDLFGM